MLKPINKCIVIQQAKLQEHIFSKMKEDTSNLLLLLQQMNEHLEFLPKEHKLIENTYKHLEKFYLCFLDKDSLDFSEKMKV